MQGVILCDECICSINNMHTGQGECLYICANCSILAVAEYINQNKIRKPMETVKSKRVLYGLIRDMLDSDMQMEFPKELSFCEHIGGPTYTFTINKSVEDHFVDERGQKWVKAD